MSGQAYAFLSALFGPDDLEDHWLYLWTLPGKRTFWYQSIDEAAKAAEGFAGVNVYVGLGLSPANHGPDKRCLNEEVVAISGVRADLDIANGVAHSKQNLPPDLAAAKSVLARLSIEPTMIVHSGYGLQAYWLFKEPWTLDNDVERAEAAALLRGWNEAVQAAAHDVGKWDVDATHDLARVFRVPGSFNVKDPANPKPVTIIEHHDERRYNPGDIEAAIPGDLSDYAVELQRDRGILPINLARTPVVNHMKMEVMAEEFPKWRRTWERKRKDLKDQSLSGYDMALASMAAYAEWADQEIADLLVAFRLKHGSEKDIKKAYRLRYISDTIRFARRSVANEQADQEVDRRLEESAARVQERINASPKESPKMPQDRSEPAAASRPPEKSPGGRDAPNAAKEPAKKKEEKLSGREQELAVVSEKLGVSVLDVIRYVGEPPVFELIVRIEGEPVRVHLGSIENLLTLRSLRNRIAEQTPVVLPSKIKGFDSLAKVMRGIARDRETGEETTVEGWVRTHVLAYLHRTKITKDWQSTGLQKVPFWKDGRAYFYLTGFHRYLTQNGDRSFTARGLAQQLSRGGVTPLTIAGFESPNKTRTSKNVYLVPEWSEISEEDASDRVERTFEEE